MVSRKYEAGTLQAGFTLIELLVVIGVIAVLASVIFPAVTRARQRAGANVCTSNLRQLYLAFAMYAQDNGNLLPPYQASFGFTFLTVHPAYTVPDRAAQLIAVLSPYTHNPDIWFCPADPWAHTASTAGLINHQYTSYFTSGILDYVPGIHPDIGPKPEPFDLSGRSSPLDDPATTGFISDCSTWLVPTTPQTDHALYTHGGVCTIVYFDGHAKTLPSNVSDPSLE